MFKIIGEMENEDHKLLLVDMSAELAQQLKVNSKDNVDIEKPLQVMINYCIQQKTPSKSVQQTPINWLEVIFDSSLAVNNKRCSNLNFIN